ncbi:MAG: hypothetical protein HN353_10880 [Bdellovibrionales bacterium]|jgi:hypothetical protein|nr:hypothetical protein [Bdellovibrionales bacterium]MBT3524799.1 hypothetical protein [Bdellovibrionales bacterium]MBT7767842.1 hypothetical protein [Bdellovibrionales bacterium]
MSSSLYQARRLTLIVLVLLMGALFISCNNNSDEEVIVGQAQLNSDTSGLINDVNRLQNSIAKGELLRSTADKERGQIVKLLNDIKIGLIRLKYFEADPKSTRLLHNALKSIRTINRPKRDSAIIDRFLNKLRGKVAELTRINGLDLNGLSWNLYSYDFSADLLPFSTWATANVWESDWGMDRSFAKVNGYDNQAWLMTPSFNLKNIKNPAFKIRHNFMINRNTGRYGSDDFDRTLILREVFKAYVSTDYLDGDPNLATWTEVSISPKPTGHDFLTVDSPEVDLSAFKDENVTIAFRYRMKSSSMGHHYITWQILRFDLMGSGNLPHWIGRSHPIFAHNFDRNTLEPFIAPDLADTPNGWRPYAMRGEYRYAKINTRDVATGSNNWLISPRYRLPKENLVKLKIAHTVLDPVWDRLKIKLSTDFSGGDPLAATWQEIDFIPSKPVEPGSWSDLVTPEIDLSGYKGKEVVIAFVMSKVEESDDFIWEIEKLTFSAKAGEVKPINFEPLPTAE